MTEAEIIKSGGVGVMPTDTLYGLVASAFLPIAVERVYSLRERNKDKPCIILISSFKDLKKFSVTINDDTKNILEKYWPGKVSVVLPCPDEKFQYLHRGTKSLAFRMPDDKKLQEFISETGPLIAPSANVQGNQSAESIEQARGYFGSNVDFYMDAGKLSGLPSTLIRIENGIISVLRDGTVKIK